MLIPLRETKHRGDIVEFWIECVIRGGLLEENEWYETEIDRCTERLQLSTVLAEYQPATVVGYEDRMSGVGEK